MTVLHSRSQAARSVGRKALLIAGALCLLAGCAKEGKQQALPPAAEETVVSLSQGDLIGFVAPSRAHVWRNIPFAAPPVGDLRWRAPRPAPSWEGRRSAVEPPEWCAQLTGPLDELYGLEGGRIGGSEDCLYLNIYAPSGAAEAGSALPVMVWVHGGSNTWGRAEEYDPSIMAERHKLVVVVPQYRLGPLGWMAHPSLSNTDGPPEDRAASFALLDQIAALGWVRDNIAAFGGDAGNVTLFGESAGAANIMGLMASPLAEGLFSKAIAQSGIAYSVPRPKAEAAVKHAFEALFGSGTPSADALRALPTGDVIRAFAGADGRLKVPTLIADGIVVPEGELWTHVVQSLSQRPVPFLFGSNRDESKFVYAFNPAFVRKQLWLFPEPRSRDFYDAVTEHTNNMWRALGVDRLATALHDKGLADYYTYRFDWDEEGDYMLSDFSHLLGAAHSIEIPFVFGTFGNYFGKVGDIIFNDDNQEGREALSRAVMSYWAAFAYGGAPGRGQDGALPMWQAANKGREINTLVLDTPAGGDIRFDDRVFTVESVLKDVRTDHRLNSDNRRCQVASELDKYFGRGVPALEAFEKEICGGD
jgi:para-nitrobenzyl esterase